MTITIETPVVLADTAEIAEVMREYLALVSDTLVETGGPVFDIDAMTADTLDNLAAYLPPRGRTFLARDDTGTLVGTVYLKSVAAGLAEIKRLYVRPAARGTGLGRVLTERAMEAARDLGATALVLDSIAGLTGARRLYEALGFAYIDRYPQSEMSSRYDPWLVFMRCAL